MKKYRFTTLNGVWIGLFVCAMVALAATWTMAKPDNSLPQPATARTLQTDNLSKAFLAVSNMSCGGCVDTITKSLADLPGIAGVSVNVAAGTAEVMFDPKALEDNQKIAKVITDAGYPAQISKIYSAQEVRQDMIRAAERAKTHIASVGRIDISRQDYTFELGHASKRYEQIYGQDVFATEQGKQLLQRIQSQIALRLIDEGIKLQEVDRTGYTISNETVDQAFNEYLRDRKTTLDQLKSDLEANDYPFTYFRKKFSSKVRLQTYLENEVLGNSVDPDARQQQYSNWLANARILAKVTYYDKELEKLVNAGSGSSCSGSGGGNCSASR